MITATELDAYRSAESLLLALDRCATRLPREAAAAAREMRAAGEIAIASLLDGCAGTGRAERGRRWAQALSAAEAIGDSVDLAADAGWMPVDTVLALLELQSGLVVRLLALGAAPIAQPVAVTRAA